MDSARQVNRCRPPDGVVHLTQVDSAPGFLSFLSGYTVIIGPITGIMLTDVCRLFFSPSSVRSEPSDQYWLVHRTRVDVPAMYRPRGRYRYTYGVVSRPHAAPF
jgi:NCS1 family nucleobase:cation symporter-1